MLDMINLVFHILPLTDDDFMMFNLFGFSKGCVTAMLSVPCGSYAIFVVDIREEYLEKRPGDWIPAKEPPDN